MKEHAIPAHCGFVVILWSNLNCMCCRGRSNEGSIWMMWHLSWWLLCLCCISSFFMLCNLLWINEKGKEECDMMLGICFCGCVWVPVRWSICLFWRETHTKSLCKRSPMRPEEDKGRKVPDTVGRTEQSREGHSQQKRTIGSQEKVSQRWELSREETSQQKSERLLLELVDLQMMGWPKREDESAFLMVCGSFMWIHARKSLQMHGELHKSVTNLSLLALGANPSSCLFVLFLSTPPVVYFVCW